MFPLHDDIAYINKDGSRTTLGDRTGDISVIEDNIDAIADSITPVSQTGTKATAAITAGTQFYLNGNLVKAKTNISIGDTFTSGTNYESADNITSQIGALDDRLTTSEGDITSIKSGYMELSKIQEFYFEFEPITVAAGGFSGDTASTNTLPTGAIVLGISRLYTGAVHSFLPYFMRVLNGKGILGVKNTSGTEQTTTLSMAVTIYNPNAT